jgi:hypothetical protein
MFSSTKRSATQCLDQVQPTSHRSSMTNDIASLFQQSTRCPQQRHLDHTARRDSTLLLALNQRCVLLCWINVFFTSHQSFTRPTENNNNQNDRVSRWPLNSVSFSIVVFIKFNDESHPLLHCTYFEFVQYVSVTTIFVTHRSDMIEVGTDVGHVTISQCAIFDLSIRSKSFCWWCWSMFCWFFRILFLGIYSTEQRSSLQWTKTTLIFFSEHDRTRDVYFNETQRNVSLKFNWR